MSPYEEAPHTHRNVEREVTVFGKDYLVVGDVTREGDVYFWGGDVQVFPALPDRSEYGDEPLKALDLEAWIAAHGEETAEEAWERANELAWERREP